MIKDTMIMGEHFGSDEIGVYRQLKDGRVLRVAERTFGRALLTISQTKDDGGWYDAW